MGGVELDWRCITEVNPKHNLASAGIWLGWGCDNFLYKVSSCADLKIEVWKGRTTDGPLFGTYCSTDDLANLINTRSSNLYIKVTMTAGALAKGASIGSWTTEDCRIKNLFSFRL